VNQFVADFIGSPSINLLSADVEGETLRGPGGFTYELDDPEPIAGHDRVRVGVRPEDITVVDSGQNTADVTVVEPMGNENFLYMEMDGHELTARVDPSIRPAEETQVSFDFREAALYCLTLKLETHSRPRRTTLTPRSSGRLKTNLSCTLLTTSCSKYRPAGYS